MKFCADSEEIPQCSAVAGILSLSAQQKNKKLQEMKQKMPKKSNQLPDVDQESLGGIVGWSLTCTL